jgi:hypothetical protein
MNRQKTSYARTGGEKHIRERERSVTKGMVTIPRDPTGTDSYLPMLWNEPQMLVQRDGPKEEGKGK